jgi:hypothetical protein
MKVAAFLDALQKYKWLETAYTRTMNPHRIESDYA